MSSFQQMIMRHANEKKIETAPEETQTVDLLDKNFKLPTLNRFKN